MIFISDAVLVNTKYFTPCSVLGPFSVVLTVVYTVCGVLHLQLSQQYVWTKREVAEAGSPFSELIDFVSHCYCECECLLLGVLNVMAL